MKKSKLFIGFAFIALTITAFVTRGEARKFVTFSTAVTLGGTMKLIKSGAFTTVASNGSQVYVCTVGGTEIPLYTKVNRIKIAYLK